MDKLGIIIKDKRESLGMTMKELGKLADISPSFISEIENSNGATPSEEKIKAFLSSFHINSDDEKEQRKAIETFVHKIIISKESIEVLMTLDPLHPVFTDSDRVGGGEAHITVSLSNFIIRTELYHEKTVVNY